MSTKYARVFLILLTIVIALGSLPTGRAAPNQPTQLSLFGLNTYITGLERNGRDGDAGVSTLVIRGREVGAAWAREELSWGNLERDGKGRWRWSHFDRRLLELAQAGYGIVGMLLTTPRWARVPDCPQRMNLYAGAGVVALDYWCPPANPQDFADYVFAVVERYDGDGLDDAPGSPRVAAWQIWNEPNAWETWPGSPAEYAAILQAGYGAAKAADPTAIVATGGLYVLDSAWQDNSGHWDGLRFFDAALAARPAIWGSFDALAIHPYMPDVAPDQPGIYGGVTLWGRLTTARSWLAERTALFGGPPRPLWISELGWSTCAPTEADCYAGAALDTVSLAADTPPAQVFLGPTASLAYSEGQMLDRESYERLDEPREREGANHTNIVPAALIGKSEQEQANYLVRAYAIAMVHGVAHLSWFQLEDKFDGSARNFWEEAAIFRNAAQGYGPKPAAVAYATLVGQLGSASFAGFGPLHSYAHTSTGPSPEARFHLRFQGSNNTVIDLIWRNTGVEEVALPLEPGAVPELLNRDGALVPLVTTGSVARLTIGETPIYLRQRFWTPVQRTYAPLFRF